MTVRELIAALQALDVRYLDWPVVSVEEDWPVLVTGPTPVTYTDHRGTTSNCVTLDTPSTGMTRVDHTTT